MADFFTRLGRSVELVRESARVLRSGCLARQVDAGDLDDRLPRGFLVYLVV
jgi:hypothetical protein